MAEPQAEVGAGAHKTKTSSWVTVGVLVVATITLGVALPLQSLALGIVGGVLVLIGVIMGAAGKIMEDVH